MPTIRVPAPLRLHTGGRGELEVGGATVGAALEEFVAAHPGVRERLLDADGGLHRFVNLFVGDDDIRDLRGLATPLGPDDVLAIVPAVAGGAGVTARWATVR